MIYVRKIKNKRWYKIVNISIIGTGYVGLVTGTCLADFGLQVICVDQDETKISLLNKESKVIFIAVGTPLQVPPSLRATEGSAAIPPSSPSPLKGEGGVRVKYSSVIARSEATKQSQSQSKSFEFDLVSNPEFRNLNLSKIKKLLKTLILLDLRNLYEPAQVKALGFTYEGVGRK